MMLFIVTYPNYLEQESLLMWKTIITLLGKKLMVVRKLLSTVKGQPPLAGEFWE